MLVQGHDYEDLAGKRQQFRDLEKAIVGKRQVAYAYQKTDGLKHYSAVSPYKLVNKGIWYLAALDGEKLKSFCFSKISQLKTLESSYQWSKEVDTRLAEERRNLAI